MKNVATWKCSFSLSSPVSLIFASVKLINSQHCKTNTAPVLVFIGSLFSDSCYTPHRYIKQGLSSLFLILFFFFLIPRLSQPLLNSLVTGCGCLFPTRWVKARGSGAGLLKQTSPVPPSFNCLLTESNNYRHSRSVALCCLSTDLRSPLKLEKII